MAQLSLCKTENDIQINVLRSAKKNSRLEEVYRLAQSGLEAIGDVNPDLNDSAAENPYFDVLDETLIITAEVNQKIIGTMSCTIDSQHGMPLDRFFPKEISKNREMGLSMLCAWRFAISPEYQSMRLSTRIMQEAVKQAFINGCDLGIFYFNSRFDRYYQRFLNGQIIAHNKISFDNQNILPVSLMQCCSRTNWAVIQKEEHYLAAS